MDESQDKKTQFRFLQSAQSRVFLAIFLIVIAVAAVAWFIHWRKELAARSAVVSVAGAPQIESIPGAGTPSEAYVKAQSQVNIAGAEAAQKAGTAFIPTITRPGFVGDPSQFGQLPDATPDASKKQCGVKHVVVMYKPSPENCTPQKLVTARQTGVTAEELLCQGCSCPALKTAGYTAGDLKNIGMTAQQLHACGFDLKELMDAGFSASDLKDAGYTAAQLKNAGFSAGELKAAGFSANDLKNAGFSAAQLRDAGFPGPESDNACDPKKLAKEHVEGVSAATLKNQGCSLEALKAAGFTAKQLKEAGFSAVALKNAGFTNADLAAAGFSAAVIKAADEASKACSAENLKKEREAGVSAAALREKGCGLSALKAAGFSAGDLRAAGFSAQELKDAGFSAADLKAAGFSAAALKAAGFSAAQLKDAGFSAQDLKAAGFNAAQLKDAGFSAQELKDAGFSPSQLKDAGFSAAQLKAAGFSAQDLKNAGFTAGQLASAGFSPRELRDAGFSAGQLRRAGIHAEQQHAAGAKASELKAGGYTSGDLIRSGFSPQESGLPAEKPVPTTLPSVSAQTPEGRLADFEKRQQEEMNEEQRQEHVRRMQAYMTEMAQKLMTGWSNVTSQQLQKAPEEKKEQAGASGAASTGAGSAATTGKEGPIIKAGSVLFAVLDTSINSDETSPIMGRIVAGPLNGSKLLGSFTRQHKRLLIRFNVLSLPFYPKTISIDAVAIDPDTARTALSGQVNNHYLLRYGTLFASSFLEGISQGIMSQGGQRSSTCVIGCTTTPTPLNTTQVGFVGLGKVGQAYASHMGQDFTRPPTIRISAGTGFGVLVMSDLTLPTAVPEKQQFGVDAGE